MTMTWRSAESIGLVGAPRCAADTWATSFLSPELNRPAPVAGAAAGATGSLNPQDCSGKCAAHVALTSGRTLSVSAACLAPALLLLRVRCSTAGRDGGCSSTNRLRVRFGQFRFSRGNKQSGHSDHLHRPPWVHPQIPLSEDRGGYGDGDGDTEPPRASSGCHHQAHSQRRPHVVVRHDRLRVGTKGEG